MKRACCCSYGSRTPDAPSWSSEVEVAPPGSVDPCLYVIAIWVVGEDTEVGHRDQAVVPVDDLQVPEVSSSAEAFSGVVAAAHLGGGVEPGWTGVEDLSTVLHHGRVPSEVAEQGGRPVAHEHAGSELQPPVSMAWILQSTACRHRTYSYKPQLYSEPLRMAHIIFMQLYWISTDQDDTSRSIVVLLLLNSFRLQKGSLQCFLTLF